MRIEGTQMQRINTPHGGDSLGEFWFRLRYPPTHCTHRRIEHMAGDKGDVLIATDLSGLLGPDEKLLNSSDRPGAVLLETGCLLSGAERNFFKEDPFQPDVPSHMAVHRNLRNDQLLEERGV